ncbi:MAG: sulfate reduction electron transfer complex DsrMKJOP subunit DsrO [Chloroflexota bacterium]
MDEQEKSNTLTNRSDAKEPQTLRRREFLKLSLAGLAVTAGPAVAWKSTRPSSAPRGDSKHSWAMVIDQQKCVGCGHCTLACRAHNDVPPEMSWNRIVEDEEDETFLSIPCMHCEDAPCVHVCPVKATYQRADGIVMMDYDRCIGCRYCEMACPYASRSFNWKEFSGDNPAVPTWGQPDVPRRPRGVVEKCTFCVERIDRGLQNGLTPGVDKAATPACVVACPTGARLFGDLNDPESPVSKALARYPSFRLRENLGTGPRVYYLPPRDKEEQPDVQEVCT